MGYWPVVAAQQPPHKEGATFNKLSLTSEQRSAPCTKKCTREHILVLFLLVI